MKDLARVDMGWLVRSCGLLDRGERAEQIPLTVELEVDSRFDFERRIRFHLAADIRAQAEAAELHGVANPADGDVGEVELANCRHDALQALAVRGVMYRGADGGGRVGGQRVDDG